MQQFVMNNLMMISIALMSGFMLFWSFFGNKIRGVKEVGTAEALVMINHKNALVLDVREQMEYDAGRIVNSRLIPLGKLKERIGELEKYRDRPIVVICRSGNRSASGAALLKHQGFTQAYSLAGGVMAWQKSNLPLER